MFVKGSFGQRLGIVVAAAAITVVAACSGGGNPTPIYPPAGSGTAGQTYQVNSVNGMNSTVAVTGTGTVSVSASASAPSVGAIPALKQRAQAASNNQAYIYYTIGATSAVTLKSLTVTVGFPTAPTTSVYLAYWSGTQWIAASAPGTYSNGTMSLSVPSTAFPVSLTAGQSFYVAVYQGQQVGTPTPPGPVVSPNPITISAGTAQTVTVTSKPGFTITAKSLATNIVTVSPATQTVTGTGSTGTVTFTVTATDVIGTGNVTFTDSINQSATLAVTTTDQYASPVPAPSAVTLSLGDTVTAAIVTQPNSTVTATSSNTAVATVPASEQANSTGNVSFTVTSVASGTATITFTDAFGHTGTLAIVVSAVANGGFSTSTGAPSLTGWTPCSYPHQPFAAPVDMTGTPIAGATPSQNPSATPSPAPSASLTPLVVATTVPNNENPTYVNTPPPAEVGSNVALVGSVNGGSVAYPKAAFGMCQSINVPTFTSPYKPQLFMWVWEGGSEYTFYGGDSEGDILDSTGTTVKQTLFAEENCFIWPTASGAGNPVSAPGATATSGCWPAAYGGDSSDYMDWVNGGYWIPKGPYDLSAYAGTTVVLYLGNWSYYLDSATKYAQFMYVGGVQLIPSSTGTFPTQVPMSRHKSVNVILTRVTRLP